jgi:hypothetical protein
VEKSLRHALGLPIVENMSRPEPATLSLQTLLAGPATGRPLELPAYSCDLPALDAPLTAPQAEAVTRALATPDLFLIQGTSGTGKSLVAARILREACRRGWRVLFLASTPAALDRTLEMLAGTPGFAAVRCLAENESLDHLPQCVRQSTLADRVAAFETVTLPAARQEIERHDTDTHALAALETPLQELASLLHRDGELTASLDQLRARRDRLPTAVEATNAPPEELVGHWQDLEQTRGEITRQQAELAAELAQCAQREQAHRAELATLRPLVEARQAGRWWTPAYWRARGKGDVQVQAATLEQSCEELRAVALRAQQAADQLQARLAEQTRNVTTALEKLRVEFASQIAQVEAERTALRERWQALSQTMPESFRPGEVTPAAHAAVTQKIADARTALERSRVDAVARVAALEQARPELAGRLAATIPVVASTLGSLARDPHFASTPDAFDLLVLEEAEQTTEADFLAVAERARRWVLIGEPVRHPDRPHDGPRRNGVARPQRPAHLRPGFFQRVWSRLHDDPSARRVAWRQDLERLVCVLATVSQEQERWIQPEPVVDHPDIVLHIHAPSRQTPCLVEVEFPAGTPIEDAKSFVFRELDELPLQTRSRCLAWEESADRVTVQLGGDLPGKSKLVNLGDGVTEAVHLLAGHWQTARLEFDRAAGWTRDKAIAWLRDRLRLPGHDRTLLLDRPHRHGPALASWLGDLLEESHRGSSATVPAPCVEFVTVPSLHDDHRHGRRHDHGSRSGGGVATLAPKLKSLRGGAGVEINLAEPRRHDLLPPELRDVLPMQGLVNYLEAQAVVRLVSELLNDPSSRAEIVAWQQARSQGCQSTADRCPPRTHTERVPGIAVLALFPSQVQLIRHLLSTLPSGPIHVEVALPEQMRHRECAVAIVSLTRSHSHRAVSYGDSPAQLVLALTRAAQRLILIGDPGTLLRRSQYGEAVDHLDETESELEQALAGRLVRYLQGHGAQQRVFTIRELAGL